MQNTPHTRQGTTRITAPPMSDGDRLALESLLSSIVAKMHPQEIRAVFQDITATTELGQAIQRGIIHGATEHSDMFANELIAITHDIH